MRSRVNFLDYCAALLLLATTILVAVVANGCNDSRKEHRQPTPHYWTSPSAVGRVFPVVCHDMGKIAIQQSRWALDNHIAAYQGIQNGWQPGSIQRITTIHLHGYNRNDRRPHQQFGGTGGLNSKEEIHLAVGDWAEVPNFTLHLMAWDYAQSIEKIQEHPDWPYHKVNQDTVVARHRVIYPRLP